MQKTKELEYLHMTPEALPRSVNFLVFLPAMSRSSVTFKDFGEGPWAENMQILAEGAG